MSLRDEGFRLLVMSVNTAKIMTSWVHPAEVPKMIACGWQDATDMDDDEYDALIEGYQS